MRAAVVMTLIRRAPTLGSRGVRQAESRASETTSRASSCTRRGGPAPGSSRRRSCRRPRCRTGARRTSRLGDDLEPADRRAVARRRRSACRRSARRPARSRSPGRGTASRAPPSARGSPARRPGRTPGRRTASTSVAVALARRRAGDRRDLRGQQAEQDAVLVGRPDAAVAAQERRAGRLLAAEGRPSRRAGPARTT